MYKHDKVLIKIVLLVIVCSPTFVDYTMVKRITKNLTYITELSSVQDELFDIP